MAPFSTASTFGGNCRGRPLPVHVAWPARGRLIGSRKVRGADKLKSGVKTEREKDGVSVRDRERGEREREKHIEIKREGWRERKERVKERESERGRERG